MLWAAPLQRDRIAGKGLVNLWETLCSGRKVHPGRVKKVSWQETHLKERSDAEGRQKRRSA
jgi:hypothetical protein